MLSSGPSNLCWSYESAVGSDLWEPSEGRAERSQPDSGGIWDMFCDFLAVCPAFLVWQQIGYLFLVFLPKYAACEGQKASTGAAHHLEGDMEGRLAQRDTAESTSSRIPDLL